jgi:acetate kinase
MKPPNPRILTVHGGSSSIKFALFEAGELHRLSLFDPEPLREEIRWAAAFHRRFPDLRQVACFDTAFPHDLPRVAQLLPIPRGYQAQEVEDTIVKIMKEAA